MAIHGCINQSVPAMMQNMGKPILVTNLRGIWRALLKTELSMSLDIGVYIFHMIFLSHLLTLFQKNSGPYHYLTWARMACDYLAIHRSATPSECAFLGGRITGIAHHNYLTPDVFEALQLLKSAYRNGHIRACTDNQIHIDGNTGDWEALVTLEVLDEDSIQ
jgi:hypothetical protein